MADETKWPDEVPRLPEEELRKFVLGVCDGRIFGSWELGSDGWGQAFLPLAMGALAKRNGQASDRFLSSIGVCYEWLDRAEQPVVGRPIFATVRLLHRDDWEQAVCDIEDERLRRRV